MKAVIDEVPSREECLGSVNAIRDALFVLNGKWKLPLIFTLLEKAKRFNEIQQSVKGITPKILSKELKDLEENGFVTRNVYPTTPVTVIYEITDYSHTLKNVLSELKLWGTQHRDMIKQSMRKKEVNSLPFSEIPTTKTFPFNLSPLTFISLFLPFVKRTTCAKRDH